MFLRKGANRVPYFRVLAFFFGYLLTLLPLLRGGFTLRSALPLALAADTISIAIMEVVDNALMLVIPGAMEAGPTTGLFWGSLILSLILAGGVAFPVNRWLISRGRGHAVVHGHHQNTHTDQIHQGSTLEAGHSRSSPH